MRRISSWFICFLAAAPLAAAACGLSEDASSFADKTGLDAGNPVVRVGDGGRADSSLPLADAAQVPVSPLCLYPPGQTVCDPDDELACSGADAGTPTASCRMASGGASCSPVGVKAAGTLCTSSEECGPGLECTGKPGTCHPYCCKGQCGPKEFCTLDRRAEADAGDGPYLARAPVCLPTKACKLLASKETCRIDETCAVVDDNGATSCVAIGAAKVGESCELQNCEARSVCLGTIGSRICLALCESSDLSACEKGATCKGAAPLFQEPVVGVCEKATMP